MNTFVTMVRLLQIGRLFLLGLLIAWAILLIGASVVAKYTLQKVEELEQQPSKDGQEEQDTHTMAA